MNMLIARCGGRPKSQNCVTRVARENAVKFLRENDLRKRVVRGNTQRENIGGALWALRSKDLRRGNTVTPFFRFEIKKKI